MSGPQPGVARMRLDARQALVRERLLAAARELGFDVPVDLSATRRRHAEEHYAVAAPADPGRARTISFLLDWTPQCGLAIELAETLGSPSRVAEAFALHFGGEEFSGDVRFLCDLRDVQAELQGDAAELVQRYIRLPANVAELEAALDRLAAVLRDVLPRLGEAFVERVRIEAS